eukprot:scaffold2584_cov231-Pinguiococcus_pyrenoidosus.AAC.6
MRRRKSEDGCFHVLYGFIRSKLSSVARSVDVLVLLEKQHSGSGAVCATHGQQCPLIRHEVYNGPDDLPHRKGVETQVKGTEALVLCGRYA